MAEKGDSSSLTNEDALKKKIMHDIFGSDSEELDDSEEASNDKQEGDETEKRDNAVEAKKAKLDGSEEGDNLTRNGDHKDFSSGFVPTSTTHYQDPQTKNMGSSSSCLSFSNINERILVYKKSLTRDDVNFCRLMIPLESGKQFLPEPEKYKGRYDFTEISVIDHKGKIWDLTAAFDEMSSSYMFFLNWDKYVKKYELKPGDVIFFYEDPTIEEYFSIQFERKDRDSNSKQKVEAFLVGGSIHNIG